MYTFLVIIFHLFDRKDAFSGYQIIVSHITYDQQNIANDKKNYLNLSTDSEQSAAILETALLLLNIKYQYVA